MVKKVKVDGGAKVAADLLAGLDPENRANVLEKMAAINPELTKDLMAQLVSLNDLPKMTMKMLQDFLRRVNQADLVLALKISEKATQDYFIEKSNRSLSREIQEVLTGQKFPKSKCIEAQAKVLKLMNNMIDEGSLILNSNEEYV